MNGNITLIGKWVAIGGVLWAVAVGFTNKADRAEVETQKREQAVQSETLKHMRDDLKEIQTDQKRIQNDLAGIRTLIENSLLTKKR